MSLPVVVSALAAAGAAYVLNRLSRRLFGGSTVVFVTPGLEESFKTGTALLAGAPVLATHIAFGAIEALYDLAPRAAVPAGPGSGTAGPETAGPDAAAPEAAGPARRVGAALAGLAGHTLFGTVTLAGAGLTGSWALGVAGAYLLHVGWNALVTGKAGTRR
ncbi:MAG: hypothetical protein AB1645_06435 [Bacillota bacterium]